jgi:hypothetical protein
MRNRFKNYIEDRIKHKPSLNRTLAYLGLSCKRPDEEDHDEEEAVNSEFDY